MFKKACSSDLLFLVDTTGSMGSYIEEAKTQIRNIVNDIKKTFFNEADVRIAVVGYKDHADKPNLEFLDFTTSADDVRAFLAKLRATGGGDAPEDVLGGVRQAINASWKHETRCMIHIADAPPHGRTLHDLAARHDDYAEPGSEPHRLVHGPLLRSLADLRINYCLLRINSSTDRMALVFSREYTSGGATGVATDVKLLASNRYHAEASSGRKPLGANAQLRFEEMQLGTSYSALRHLVVSSVTNSATRTAVRLASADSKTATRRDPAMTSLLDSIGEDDVYESSELSGPVGGSKEVLLETGPPQWDTPGWLDETRGFDGFSPDVLVHSSDTLSNMMEADENIRLGYLRLTIHWRSKAFAQGAMRAASYARTAHSSSQFVTKAFKEGGKGMAHVVEDMRSQALCKAFALEFNALVDTEHMLDFIVTTCLDGSRLDGRGDCISLEPYIGGKYVKYNNNCGWVSSEEDDAEHVTANVAAQAFSHFTFERSWGRFMVSDLQGVGRLLTDPAVHTASPDRFKLGKTNLGSDGFKFFFATHECNDVCRRLRLESTAAMLMSGDYHFRESWPTMNNTVCCSNKLCRHIIRTATAHKSDRFPGHYWCSQCWPQLSSTTVRWICVAPGPNHEFELSRFFHESQGQDPPRRCPEHQDKDETVSRAATIGGTMWTRMKEVNKKDSFSGKMW
jgi:hypothetical protein